MGAACRSATAHAEMAGTAATKNATADHRMQAAAAARVKQRSTHLCCASLGLGAQLGVSGLLRCRQCRLLCQIPHVQSDLGCLRKSTAPPHSAHAPPTIPCVQAQADQAPCAEALLCVLKLAIELKP